MRCQMKFIGRHRVTISTNTTLGNFLQMGFPPGHFTHVLIDEAGQCTEPETMVPISLLVKDKSQVILAGDPRQLQAIVINRFSIHKEFARSFLERLLDRPPYKKDMHRFPNSCGYNPMCLTKLLNNYRALPTIMCTYSRLFYDNELIPMVSEEDSREIRLLERAKVVFEPITKEIPKSRRPSSLESMERTCRTMIRPPGIIRWKPRTSSSWPFPCTAPISMRIRSAYLLPMPSR